jgi:hypothetical protein
MDYENNEKAEEKALGRRLGRNKKPKRAGQIIRRYVRGARFDNDATDADGDGIVQENTQYARRVTRRKPQPTQRVNLKPQTKPTRTQIATPKRQSRNVNRIVLLNDRQRQAFADQHEDEIFEIQANAIKTIPPEIAKETWDEYDKLVTDTYGPINTVQEAIDAFIKAHPSVRGLTFLAQPGDTPLTYEQRGTVRGYLYALTKFDLSEFDIEFSKGAGNSTQAEALTGKTIRRRPVLTFEYSESKKPEMGKKYFKEIWVQGALPMDTISNQMGLAYMKNPWDGEFGTAQTDEEKATQIIRTIVAVHEGMHAVNIKATMKEAFGKKNRSEQQVKLEEVIQNQDQRLLEPLLVNFGLQQLQKFAQEKKTIKYLEKIKAKAEQAETPEEKEKIVKMQSNGQIGNLETVNILLQQHEQKLEEVSRKFKKGGIYEKHEKLLNEINFKLDENDSTEADFPNRQNRAALIALGEDYLRYEGDKIKPLERPYIYRGDAKIGRGTRLKPHEIAKIWDSLIDELDNIPEDDVNAAIERLKRLTNQNGPQEEQLDGTFGRWATELYKLVQKSKGEPETGQIGKKEWDEIFTNQIPENQILEERKKFMLQGDIGHVLAYSGLTYRHILDKLTDQEKTEAIEWMNKYSTYGSEKRHSYYDNTALNQMVELPAELHTALQIAKGTPIPPAIQKLFTWHFDNNEYERITK